MNAAFSIGVNIIHYKPNPSNVNSKKSLCRKKFHPACFSCFFAKIAYNSWLRKQFTNMQENKLNNTLSGLGGRFFGLHTKAGEAINAQVVNVTPQFVTVYDRNNERTRKVAKSSISAIVTQGQTIR